MAETVMCFAHGHHQAVAHVFVGPGGRLEWLPVCCNCAANHRRAGHQLVPVLEWGESTFNWPPHAA